MALRTRLILRRPRRGRLEGRTVLIQRVFDFFTRSFAGVASEEVERSRIAARQRQHRPPD